ncbi:MAG: hypothetical protein P4L56_22140 [Candidatus Sulfopaludibacter sp.]|nr:hypothetical protein [Candidatus Sulfopaludibacter sp.]
MSPTVLRPVLADNPDAMPADVRLAWKFTRTTLAHDAAADEYREAIVKRWGRRALVSLAFAIAAGRIYPTVKYALGHGKACVRVVVGGTPVMFDHGRVTAAAGAAVRTRQCSRRTAAASWANLNAVQLGRSRGTCPWAGNGQR